MATAQADSAELYPLPGTPMHVDSIISRVIEAKPRNDYESLPGWQFDITTNEMVYVDKVASLEKRPFFKPFRKILDDLSLRKQDTSERFIPIFNFKNHSTYYYRKDPYLKKEVVHAYLVEDHGIFNDQFMGQLTGKTFVDFDFYRNNIDLFDKLFISPIADKALKHYNYTFIKTIKEDGRTYYVIYFTAKREWRRNFYGELNIDSATYALAKLSVGFGHEAGINFVEYFTLDQYYTPLHHGDSIVFFPEQMNMFLKVQRPYLKTVATQAEICSQNNNIVLAEPEQKTFYRRRIKLEDSSDQRMAPEFYASTGQCQLTTLLHPDEETGTYGSRFIITLGEIAATRYVSIGPIGIGPLLEIYSQNAVEGNRFQLGFRTKSKFKSNFRFKGYLAYGDKDDRFKHNFQVQYYLSKNDWTIIGFQRDFDLFSLGTSEPFFANNSFTPASDRFGDFNKFFFTTEHTLWFETDYYRSLTAYIIGKQRNMRPEGNFIFSYFDKESPDSIKKKELNSSEVTLQFNFAPDEFFLHSGNSRYVIRTGPVPTLTLAYTHGFEGVLKSDFNYDKIVAEVAQRTRFRSVGRLEYSFVGKKIFTPLPYPLLNFARGNESIILKDRAFNLVNLNEFVSDESISAFLSFHFEGNLVNRVPLFRRLDWRVVTSFAAGYGHLTKESTAIIPATDAEGHTVTPIGIYESGMPYAEAGFGFENVFRFFKIEYFQRLTYLDNPAAQQYGIKGGFYLNF